MRLSRSTLHGRRGWSAVVGLSTVLTVLVAGQLPAASAASPVAAALGALTASAAPSAPALGPVVPLPHVTATTSAGDRLASAAPLSKPVSKPPVQPVAARAAAAKPAAAPLCSGTGWQERRGRAALASLKSGAAGRTGFRIEFKGARKGYMGLTHLDQRRIEMFVRPCGTQSDELLRHVMAHELGHAYDTVHMSSATRRAWMSARGIPAGTPWYGCSSCTDFATPAGDFAEVYAQWARGASTNRSQLAGDVPPAQLAQLARQFFGA